MAIASLGGDASAFILVEAHRGDSKHAPENTVASIQLAGDSADLSEMDVRETADGALVLMHDGTVNRTTNGTGSVSSLSLAHLQTLDAGSWFSPSFAGEPVPTLAEAVAASRAAGVQPLVERKTGAASLYHSQFQALSLANDEFRVIAFDWGFLDDLDRLNPAYNLGALGTGTINQAVIDAVAGSGADFLDWNDGGVNQAAVDLVHANGMELHVWTVNSPSRMQQLIDYGVDGITTDNPAMLRDLLPSFAAGLALEVDRDSGDVRLKNGTSDPIHFEGYSIESPAGAFNPPQWRSIADNYDAGSPGPDQVDPNDEWTKLWISDFKVSESAPASGSGATLPGNSSILLGSDLWLRNPFENDLQMELTLPGGITESVAIEFEGNGGLPYRRGDFDFDGDLDSADWMIHNAGRGADLAGMSIAQGYQRGDFDGNGAVDMADFVGFKSAFEAANGPGSFAAMLAVPEPHALALCLAALTAGLRTPRQPSARTTPTDKRFRL